MQFLRRILGGRGQRSVPALALFENSAANDSRNADTLSAALDMDAAIRAHECWKARLMDTLEGRTTEVLDPATVRRDDQSALGQWLHGVGREILGDQPAFSLLMAHHHYFHEQAALLLEMAQQGEWDKAVEILNGGYRYSSSQVVRLLKELKRGLG